METDETKPDPERDSAQPAKAPPYRNEPPLAENRAWNPPADDKVFYCDLCGAQMYECHCKILCQNCGYVRDCSDP